MGGVCNRWPSLASPVLQGLLDLISLAHLALMWGVRYWVRGNYNLDFNLKVDCFSEHTQLGLILYILYINLMHLALHVHVKNIEYMHVPPTQNQHPQQCSFVIVIKLKIWNFRKAVPDSPLQVLNKVSVPMMTSSLLDILVTSLTRTNFEKKYQTLKNNEETIFNHSFYLLTKIARFI